MKPLHDGELHAALDIASIVHPFSWTPEHMSREHFEAAENAVHLVPALLAALDVTYDAEPCTDAGPLLSPTRCECCGRMMIPGERAATDWDDDAGQVYMHFWECPEPEMWAAQCADHEGNWHPILRDDALPDEVPIVGPYEEAWLEAWSAVMSVGDMLGGVRLVRVRPRQALTEQRATEGA